MQNQYIVDAFLSGTLWALIAYLFFEVRATIAALSGVMDASLLSVALSQVVKKASITAIPFCLFLLFLLWRFYGLMIASEAWGAGGAGLLVILFVVGVALVWLQVVLTFVRTSGFVSKARQISASKHAARDY